MFANRMLATAATLALMTTLVFAQATPQTTPKAKPAAPAPAVTTPAKPATPAATAPVAKKINLNTATAAELDTLPQIGPARAKAIIAARAKGKFKDWNDFVARNVVPSNAEAAIRDLVSF